MAVKRSRMELFVNGSPRRVLASSCAHGSNLGSATVSFTVDPADGDITPGDLIEVRLGYNFTTTTFKGEVNELGDDMSPNWLDGAGVGELRKASRKTNIIDEVASGLNTNGYLI